MTELKITQAANPKGKAALNARITTLEAELAEAKAEIERLADNGCHLEMLLAAMKVRGDRLANFAEAVAEFGSASMRELARQALTEWRDQ